MTLTRFKNYVNYGGTRPDDISEGRWNAMLTQLVVNHGYHFSLFAGFSPKIVVAA